MSATRCRTDDQPTAVGGMLAAVALATALALAGCAAAPAGSVEARLPAAGPRSIVISLDHPPVAYRMITEQSTTGQEAARGAGEGAGAGALFGLYMTLELAAGTGGIELLADPEAEPLLAVPARSEPFQAANAAGKFPARPRRRGPPGPLD